MEEVLIHAIQVSLANHCTNNALFLSEQLVAHSTDLTTQTASEQSLYYLATCYLKAGKPGIAYEVLKSSSSAQNLYLRSVAASQCGRWHDVQIALHPPQGILKDEDFDSIPNGAFGIYLLGQAYSEQGMKEMAAKFYDAALLRNPFLFAAYQSLATLKKTDSDDYFGSAEMIPEKPTEPATKVSKLSIPGKYAPRSNPTKMQMDAEIPGASSQSSPLSTPALVNKVKKRLSPMVAPKLTMKSQRMMFDTPQTPAASILGLAPLNTPMFPTLGYGAVSDYPGSSLTNIKDTTLPIRMKPLETPSRNPLDSGALPSSHPPAASPKKRSIAKHANKTHLAKETAPTPKRAATAVSTPQASKVTAPPSRVIPARAAKTKAAIGGRTVTGTASTSLSSHHQTPPVASSNPNHPPPHASKVGPKQTDRPRQNHPLVFDEDDRSHTIRPLSFSGPLSPASGPSSRPSSSMEIDNPMLDAIQTSLLSASTGAHSSFQPTGNEDAEPLSSEADLWTQGCIELFSFFRYIGTAITHFSHNTWDVALKLFEAMGNKLKNSTSILHYIAICYWEMNDPEAAKTVFQHITDIAPYQVKGMAAYSSILWQTGSMAELAHLAHRVLEIDSRAAESWCVVGNGFSLQKDSESAIVAFKRAVLCEPQFSYAHVLLGHEYACISNFDKAYASFRESVRLDPKQYRGYYGMGRVHFEKEIWTEARLMFERAASSNPSSSNLWVRIALCFMSSGNLDSALRTLKNAVKINPKSLNAKFHLASALLASNNPMEAKEYLVELEKSVPECFHMHLLKNRFHELTGDQSLADEELERAKRIDEQLATHWKGGKVMIQDPPEILM